MKKLLLSLSAMLLLAALVFTGIYFTRFQSMATLQKITDYSDGYNLYRVDIRYRYSLNDLLARGITDDQSMVDAILEEALPLLPVTIQAPSFGCTAFAVVEQDGTACMGRNYDFRYDTSAMVVYCSPQDSYRSVAFAALDNIQANTPEQSLKTRLATLTAPFICLDGMNEKGVSIAVLTLDSEPVHQNTGKPTIATTLAIRLVLDRAATTEEAVQLLSSYDMFASSGRDYHFYITDASGDGRVVEYDCEKETRPLVATPMEAITNFYGLYRDKVLPNQRNGIYGHGRERYDAVMKVLEEQAEGYTNDTVWDALKASSQEPNPVDITSNTQWSIAYNNTGLTAEIVIRRHWDEIISYSLSQNDVTR